ncbi:MAG: hypothetical protein ACOX8N_02250 [Christensenellales bacterium]|jgi:hypothetical protein
MKERLSRKKLSTPLGLLVVLGLVAGILLIYTAVFIVADALGLRYYHQYIAYALLIVLGVIIVRRWLTEYEYRVANGELIVERYLGDRSRELLRIRLKNILHIGPEKPRGMRLQRLTFRSRRRGVTYVVYRQGSGDEAGMFFSPTPALIDLIEQKCGAAKPEATE